MNKAKLHDGLSIAYDATVRSAISQYENAVKPHKPFLNSDGTIQAQCMDSADFAIANESKSRNANKAFKELLQMERFNARVMDESFKPRPSVKAEYAEELVNMLNDFFKLLEDTGLDFNALPDEAKEVLSHTQTAIEKLTRGGQTQRAPEYETQAVDQTDGEILNEQDMEEEGNPDLAPEQDGAAMDSANKYRTRKQVSELQRQERAADNQIQSYLNGTQTQRSDYDLAGIKSKPAKHETGSVEAAVLDSAELSMRRAKESVYGKAREMSAFNAMAFNRIQQESDSAREATNDRNREANRKPAMTMLAGGVFVLNADMEKFIKHQTQRRELVVKKAELERRRTEFADATSPEAASAKYDEEIQECRDEMVRCSNVLRNLTRNADGVRIGSLN